MKNRLKSLLALLFFSSFQVSYGTQTQATKRQFSALQGLASEFVAFPYQPVGCFRDAVTKPRPFPEMIANLRNEIDLTNPNKTVAKCAAKSYIGQFQYFGIEYMGECWSGLGGNLTYNKFGPSSECLNGLGGDESLFVYRFNEPPKPVLSSLSSMRCFPSDATVQLKNGQRLPMSNLKIGHEVKTLDINGATKFSEVIGFLHKTPAGMNRFLRLHLERGRHISLTSEHLIYIRSPDGLSQLAVFAKDVKVGHNVVTSGGVVTSVLKITTVNGVGLYAPLTMDGGLLVDDTLVSCYAHVRSHVLAHTVMAPVRGVRVLLSFVESVLPKWNLQSDNEYFINTVLNWYTTALLYFTNLLPFQSNILSASELVF